MDHEHKYERWTSLGDDHRSLTESETRSERHAKLAVIALVISDSKSDIYRLDRVGRLTFSRTHHIV